MLSRQYEAKMIDFRNKAKKQKKIPAVFVV